MKLQRGLTRETLLLLESIARDLLLKRAESQHQVSYICMSIYMVMMENQLLVNKLELYMYLLVEEQIHLFGCILEVDPPVDVLPAAVFNILWVLRCFPTSPSSSACLESCC